MFHNQDDCRDCLRKEEPFGVKHFMSPYLLSPKGVNEFFWFGCSNHQWLNVDENFHERTLSVLYEFIKGSNICSETVVKKTTISFLENSESGDGGYRKFSKIRITE